MKLLADLHISPRTVTFLGSLGHDVIRADALLPTNAADEDLIAVAVREERTILTQDLDFSAMIALAGRRAPSLINLRLSSSRVEHVNAVLVKALPELELAVLSGVVVTVEDQRVRQRSLPL